MENVVQLVAVPVVNVGHIATKAIIIQMDHGALRRKVHHKIDNISHAKMVPNVMYVTIVLVRADSRTKIWINENSSVKTDKTNALFTSNSNTKPVTPRQKHINSECIISKWFNKKFIVLSTVETLFEWNFLFFFCFNPKNLYKHKQTYNYVIRCTSNWYFQFLFWVLSKFKTIIRYVAVAAIIWKKRKKNNISSIIDLMNWANEFSHFSNHTLNNKDQSNMNSPQETLG